jgi:hypothetical protein
MKTARLLFQYIAIALIGITFFLQHDEALLAGRRDDVKGEIEEAKSYMKALDETTDVHPFIPFQNYSNAKVYLDTAVYQFEEEREYDASSFYAVIASVEIRTTHLIAKARYWQHKKLEFERDLMKDIVANGRGRRGYSLLLRNRNYAKAAPFTGPFSWITTPSLPMMKPTLSRQRAAATLTGLHGSCNRIRAAR